MEKRRPEENSEFRHIDRLTGRNSAEDAAQARELADDGQGAPVYENREGRFELREVEKTERDLEIIRTVERSVDGLMRRYGREKTIAIPPENIHLVAAAENVGGYYDARRQQLAVVKEPGDNAVFAATMFHELVHAKSFNALKVKEQGTDGREIVRFRTGLETVAADGKTRFRELNEAIVQTLTLDFFDLEMRKDPVFLAEIAAAEMAGRDPKEREEGSYYVERAVLTDIVNGIVAAKGEAGDRQAVMDIFARASVTGDVFALRQAVEEVWGSGSFRALGESMGGFYRTYLAKKDPTLAERIRGLARRAVDFCSSSSDDQEGDGRALSSRFRRGLKSILK